mgnify:CR=1 FL=1
MTLDEAHEMVGQKVVYWPTTGRVEEGVITSVTPRYVFVRYGNDVGSKATAAEALEPLARSPQRARLS